MNDEHITNGELGRILGSYLTSLQLLNGKIRPQGPEAGVHITACKACADKLEVTNALEKLGIEVKYWGVPFTEILKSGESLLTI